jgi:hypothetical protein
MSLINTSCQGMADERPSKRQRASETAGGAYHDTVPLGDEYNVIHSRETFQRQVGSTTYTAHAERSAQPDTSWDSTTSWAPLDDPNYALDADETWYNDTLEADIMDDISAQQPQKKQSRVSVSSCLYPHCI